jgi:hypothetical protein
MVQAGRPRTEPADNDVLLSTLDGGLNYNSSILALPAGDTPDASNVEITDEGSLRARRGTKFHEELSAPSVSYSGNTIVPFTTKAGNNLVITKQENDCVIYSSESGTDDLTLTKRITKTDVWPDIAANSRPDHIVTSEPISRVIFVSEVTVPVQLQIVESNTVSNGVFTSFEVPSELYEHATVNDVIVWINGSVVTPSSVSYSSGSLTVAFSSDQGNTGANAINMAFITWQWLCQGIQLVGTQVFQSVTRFKTTVDTDLSLAIPVELLQNTDPEKGPLIALYLASARGTGAYTHRPDHDLDGTWNYYSFTSGQVLNDSATTGDAYTVPGISHVTFGAFHPSADYLETYFVRAVPLDFDGDDPTGFDADLLKIYINQTEAHKIYSSNFAGNTALWGEGVVLRDADNDTFMASPNDTATMSDATSDTVKYLTFDGTVDIGISGDSVIEVLYLNATGDYHGDGCQALHSYVPRNGYAWPLFGIQEHADYLRGSFPRTVKSFQGRLVFGGFPSSPMRIVTSEVAGTSLTGYDFVNYSNKWEDLQPTDPVLVPISTDEPGAYVTALGESAGSLIVFTTEACFRVYGGDNALTPTTVIVSRIAGQGCVNSASLVSIDNSIFFLSTTGVFRVGPSLEIGDFDVRMISTKVNNAFKNPANRRAGYMSYDRADNRIFVGVVGVEQNVSYATELFVLSVTKAAWFRYSLADGYWKSIAAGTINDTVSYTLFFMNYNDEVVLISFPFYYSTDITKVATKANLSSVGASVPYFSYNESITPETLRPVYPTAPDIRFTTYPNLEDVGVSIDNIRQEFGNSFFKVGESQVYINRQISAGNSLTFFPVDEQGNYPLVVYVDNADHTEFITANVNGTDYEFTVDSEVDDNAIVRAGLAIKSFYATPVFTRGSALNRKFIQDCAAVLDNRPYWEMYTQDDVNSASSQDVGEIIATWRRTIQLRIGAVRNNDNFVLLTRNNVVGSTELLWGLGDFGYDSPAEQGNALTVVNATPKGNDLLVQLLLWKFSDAVFNVIGLQVVAPVSGRSVR